MNNNESIKIDLKSVISQENLTKEPEKSVEVEKNVADDDNKESVEPKVNSADTNNGEENSDANNLTEGDSKVDDASEVKNAKTEQSDVSTNEVTVIEATKESSNLKNTTENLENNGESGTLSDDDASSNSSTNGKIASSEKSQFYVQKPKVEPTEADVTAETSQNGVSKKSPNKKTPTKKRKSRPQKKWPDYSQFVQYGLSVSQRQRRYYLQKTHGRIPIPDDDCEIFVSNIPINVLEPELIPLFERFGKIFELRLMMSLRNPKRNAGFAFVRYTANTSANEATEKLNEYEILPGKHLSVRLSQPNLSLFVGNIHRGLTREQIHEKISNKTPGEFAFSF